MGIVDEALGVLKVKIKPRQDSYSDQFSRIFMLKVMLLGAFFTGMTWYNDKINCLATGMVNADFAKTSCWINGFYIYDEAGVTTDDIGYYGIPRDVKLTGINPIDKSFCEPGEKNVYGQRVSASSCRPMKKRFFIQYQYITFFFVLMGALYYAPYTYFKFVNTDIASLKTTLKNKGKAANIVENYFNRGINPASKLNLRIFGVFTTKVLYIFANVMVFLLTNIVLNGNYQNYGQKWNSWAELNNSMAYDYMGRRSFPKPGNYLLPSFALCDVYEGAMDVKTKLINKHTVICELSQHVIYQYILILIWWAMIFGICVSVVGFIKLFVDYVYTLTTVRRAVKGAGITPLRIRECEYLEYIRRKNIVLYGEVMAILTGAQQERLMENDQDTFTKEGTV